ncbi:FtsK/SpoIIIE domain-containing protein [Streptomyces sp. M41]|uniref:FtsK/SpoIIIE domain-containing protein n=1 Tax=Streptomyces sp. M41 TaxID=3059412 RepID=UPI00374DFAC1
MQIRLTVVDPLAPPAPARGRAASCDVLVTAPAGTALAAVASALASAVSGGDGPVVLYAGAERLDDRRSTLGEPPLTDGAVLSLGAPLAPEPHPELDDAPTQLHVVAGPDAGGVHLLHGGEIRIGRSADADVPLDDPDVSRLHCAVTVAADGRVSVADLGSTNGTTLDGSGVTTRPVRFAPGALLRIGESALRLAPAGGPGTRVPTEPDGEGHTRVPAVGGRGVGDAAVGAAGPRGDGAVGSARAGATVPHARVADGGGSSAQEHGHGGVEPPVVPVQGGAPRIEWQGGSQRPLPPGPRGDETHGAGVGGGGRDGRRSSPSEASDGGYTAHGYGASDGLGAGGGSGGSGGSEASGGSGGSGAFDASDGFGGSGTADASEGARPAAGGTGGGRRKGTPLRGTDVPPGVRKRGGLGAWARRLTGGRGDQGTAARRGRPDDDSPAETRDLPSVTRGPRLPDTWPDPASLLLTALGPGPRLWERAPGHPEALTVRLGTADRTAPDGSGLLPAVPVTADLREAGALGLAGPRERLSGLARAVIAQLAALHSPDVLELVLISTDRSRTVQERTAEWAWLGWLPHVRPGHGQDCRLLLAYDREQAMARTEELLRRLEDMATDTRGEAAGSAGDPARGMGGPAPAQGAVRRPSWALADDPAGSAGGFAGPYTVVVVDGDPGGADVREAVARLALEGPTAGIHVVCLAETASASPASPVTETYEAACTVSPTFRECGAVALLSGDVATALRLMRVARTGGADAAQGGAGTAPGGAGPAPRGAGPAPAGAADRGVGGRDFADQRGGGRSAAGPATGDHGPVGHTAGDHEPVGHSATGHGSVDQDTAGPTTADHGPAENSTPGHGTVGHGHGHSQGQSHRPAEHDPRGHDPRGHGATGPSAVGHGPQTRGAADSPAHQGTDARTAVGPGTPHGTPHTTPHHNPVGQDPTPSPVTPSADHGPVGPGTVAVVDAVSPAWAERFARALAPLRTEGAVGERHARVSVPLPQAARLLDELGLARATPASLMARWADAADDTEALGGRACAVLGAGPRGPVGVDLRAEGPHLLIEGPPGSGRTELLRAVVASLAAAERPDRLGVVLIDGRDGVGSGGAHGEGLRVCTDVPHVTTHLTANDPVRMREFAQSLSAELKRRAELLGRSDFTEWHTGRELSGRMIAQRSAGTGAGGGRKGAGTNTGSSPGTDSGTGSGGRPSDHTGDLDTPPSSTIRLRPGAARRQAEAEAVPPLPRLVVVVDDLDALISPALGSTGRPAAGSVIRALEAVAREGERLGVHLVAAAGLDSRTAESEPARRATLRVTLDAVAAGPDEPAPGRGRLTWADGRAVPFQGGRVTGRIPRTATLRPTVVPLEWHRMGDPPARRPVRELGNGPTDLALLASALERAAREVSATEVPSLL